MYHPGRHTYKNKNTRCPEGKVLRSSYTRSISSRVIKEGYTRKTKTGTVRVFPKKRSTYVKAACIDKPATGNVQIGPLKEGELKRFGYLYKAPEAERHRALERAIRDKDPLTIYHRLNAVAKLSKTSAPQASAVFAADRNWIHKKYETSGVLRKKRE
jgi:hypothetical protein